MNRETESRLLGFATSQHGRFDASEWLHFPHPDREELAAAAFFLAGTDWYGHRRALLEAAESLAPGFRGRLSELVARTNFDLSRFSNQLRRSLDHAKAAP